MTGRGRVVESSGAPQAQEKPGHMGLVGSNPTAPAPPWTPLFIKVLAMHIADATPPHRTN